MMANIILQPDMPLEEKLKMMHESARFDISDDDALANGRFGNYPGMHEIHAPPTPPKVPKLFLSNDCIFNCAYCTCRSSRDCNRRYTNTPDEMARIAVKTAKNNGHGVFLTSAVYRNPDYTEELIIETLRRIRREHGYTGYIHAKIMPGADPKLIEEAGYLADRLSVNIELPRSEGYALIAKQKSKKAILKPMAFINEKIKESGLEKSPYARKFARSGQITQMMVGTMSESDRVLLTLAEAIYKKYDLRRVYYSPFNPVQDYEHLPSVPTPRWRARRLYQADRLLQLYGFKADELAPEEKPDFDFDLDPKAGWALRNLYLYPVEVNTADYELLIRVPGIGVTSAKKILQARRYRNLTHETLLQIGISLKKAKYFITCGGKYTGGDSLGRLSLRDRLADKPLQLSIFDYTPLNQCYSNPLF